MAAKKFGLLASLTLLLTLQAPTWQAALSPHPLRVWNGDRAIAQTPDVEAMLVRFRQANQLEIQAEKDLEAGQYAPAIEKLQQARRIYGEINKPEGQADVDFRLAKAYLLKGDYPIAVPLFQQQVAGARAEGFGTERPLALLGLTYYEMGRYAEAETALREAVAGWEKLRTRADNSDADRLTLLDQLTFAYRLLQKALVAQNKTDAALEIAELGRARTLAELLAQRSSGTALPPPTVRQLQEIARAQNSTLVQYAIVGRERRVLNIEPRDETHLYIWVISPAGRVTFRSVDLKAAGVPSLKELVLKTREDTIGVRGRGLGVVAKDGSTRGTNPDVNHLRQLHRILIEPIADQLPTQPNARITFIPESSLLLVPFAALQDASGKHLIQQHTIRIAPSIQVLSLTQQRRQQNRPRSTEALVVGNPTMPNLPASADSPAEPLAALPGAEREARAIAQLLKTQFLTGNQATKQAVLQRLSQARFVHLATHGLLDLDANLNEFGELTTKPATTARDGNVFLGAGVIIGPNVLINGVPASVAAAREGVVQVEMPGAIALAPTAQDRGFLTAKEILDLRLNAELVVLSACDTGRGRITGDGVVGLSRALIAAGVPSIVVSLWAVPDAPTASLMTEFYQNLQQGQDKAQALRQAMLTTLQQYPDPRDWAAFTLIGEAE